VLTGFPPPVVDIGGEPPVQPFQRIDGDLLIHVERAGLAGAQPHPERLMVLLRHAEQVRDGHH
jgi:hypothetical protein